MKNRILIIAVMFSLMSAGSVFSQCCPLSKAKAKAKTVAESTEKKSGEALCADRSKIKQCKKSCSKNADKLKCGKKKCSSELSGKLTCSKKCIKSCANRKQCKESCSKDAEKCKCGAQKGAQGCCKSKN